MTDRNKTNSSYTFPLFPGVIKVPKTVKVQQAVGCGTVMQGSGGQPSAYRGP